MVTIMTGIKKSDNYNDYISIIVLRTLMIRNMSTNCHDKNCDCTIAFKILKTLIIVVIDSSRKNNF